MRINLLKAIFPIMVLSTASFAHQIPSESALFFGLGGSYNSVKVDQSLIGIGISNVFIGPLLVAFGQAGGPAVDYHHTDNTFAPVVQFGYVHSFGHCFWGVKFLYEYLGITLTHSPINLPQTGTVFTNVASPDTFTGNVAIQSTQTLVNHELALLAYLGHYFKQNEVYVGFGPAVFRTKTNQNNGIGFADLNGVHMDMTGAPVSFTNSKWAWGGAAQIGLSRNLSHTWVLDLCYTFAISSKFSSENSGSFSSSQIVNALEIVNSGNFLISDSQRITSQAIVVSINKLFLI